jgi:RNA polymerase sigma-70 factor, ECF subfamily
LTQKAETIGSSVHSLATIATAAGGQRREFELFYREQFPLAWRTLSRLGVAPRDCDDAAQEVFVTAYRRWSSVRDPSWRRAWLVGIARRIASRYRRGSERRTRKHDAFAQLDPPGASLDHELMRREAWRALLGFLDSLEPNKREAFVLGELEELSRPELAAALGVRPSTAYSRLLAARRDFVEHFAQLGDDACARVLAHAVPDAPSSEQEARAWAGIAPLVAAPLPAAISIAAPGFGKLAALVIVGTIAVGAVTVRDDPERRRASPPTAIETPVAPPRIAALAPATLPATVQPAAPMPGPAPADAVPAARRADRPLPPPAPAPRTPDAAAEEVTLLKAAREAVIAGDLSLARRRLDDHRRRFGADARLAELRGEIERSLGDARVVRASPGGDDKGEEHRP